jgi:hypothetical protein
LIRAARVYQVLEFSRSDTAYDPLRDLVGSFIRTRFPVGPGDVVFGKPVERRVLHSIRTLSIETRLHPKRLRKLLEAAGTLPEGSSDHVDGNCLFDAQRGDSVAQKAAAATLSVRQAGKYLNAPRVQRDRLYRAGIIEPRIRGDGAADQFAPADLDAFLARLLDGAEPVATAGDGQANIPHAAKLGFCMSEDIVRLVLDSKLKRKWKLVSERGYMRSVLWSAGPIMVATPRSRSPSGCGSPTASRPPSSSTGTSSRSPSSTPSTDAPRS